MEIPAINISQPTAEVGAALVEAAATYGFVFIENEGSDIPQEMRERMFHLVFHAHCDVKI
jgi:hypothetical protein